MGQPYLTYEHEMWSVELPAVAKGLWKQRALSDSFPCCNVAVPPTVSADP